MRLETIISAALVTAAATFIVAGCEHEEPHGPQKAQSYVDEWAPTVEENLTDRTEGASVQKALQERMKSAAKAEADEARRQLPPYDILIDAAYGAIDYKPRLVQHGELTEKGKAAWSALQTVEGHALPAAEFDVEAIGAGLAELEKLKGDATTGDLSPDESEKAWAVTYVAEKVPSEFALTADSYPLLTDTLVAEKGDRLEGVMADYEALGEKLGVKSAEVEQMLARALAHYSYRMKHHKMREIFIHPREDDRYNDPELRSRRPDEAKGSYLAGVVWRRAAAIASETADPEVITKKRIAETLAEILTTDDPNGVVTGLQPQQPQYAALVKEYARYRKIVDEGGWEEVPTDRGMKKGDEGPAVLALKKRLKTEGYFSGPMDEKFGDALETAVKTYQTTHQMTADGKGHTVFWRSLNIPATDRAEQIALNIKRWRETNIRHSDEIYVFINIPDFTAEVWEAQAQAMRFEIVVGNNDLSVDEESGDKTRPNRTPFPLAAYIDRVIYNPFWNVTPRIRAEEILPEVKKEVEAEYKALLAKWEAKKNGGAPKPINGSPLLEPDPEGASEVPTGVTSPPSDTPSGANTRPADSDATLTNTVSNDGIPALGLDTEPEALDPLLQKIQNFPYLNEETGEIDVSVTDPDHIPAWYAANNYEVMYPGKSWEYVRMTPGEHNALGYVKVIFPNFYDVYLHDTNAKALFSRPIRAFSHGCMRMSKPLDFAEYLLRREDKFETNKVPAVLKNGEYLPIFFDRQIPVYIEYYTVRVDSEGRANFLADIYDHDEKGTIVPEPPPTGIEAAP